MNRQAILDRLKTRDVFDLSIVGGIAVDAASRGLKVAQEEKNDFEQQEHQARPRRRALPGNGGQETRPGAIPLGQGSPVRTRHLPAERAWDDERRKSETAETVETESARERLRISADCKHIS
jgi:hypothetical protein